MKKIFVLMIGCLLAGVTYAQSTCETRVDAHQKATTNQRVAYCLTPDTVTVDNSYTGLVFSGVSTHPVQTVQPAKQERPTAKPGRFNPDKVTVERSYVATAQFPQVVPGNGQAIEESPVIVSSNTKVVMLELDETTPQVTTIRPVEHFMSDEVSTYRPLHNSLVTTETKAGLKARQNKPNRNLKQVAVVEETVEQTVQTVQPTDADHLDAEQTDEALSDIPDTIGANNMYEEIPTGDASLSPTSN